MPLSSVVLEVLSLVVPTAEMTMATTWFLVVLTAVASPEAATEETVTAWREEEKDRKGKVKKSLFSNQAGDLF